MWTTKRLTRTRWKTHDGISDGLVLEFKKGWGLKNFKSHGKVGDFDLNPVDCEIPHIRTGIKSFNHKDVLNADGFGLCKRQAQVVTVARSYITGRKVTKESIYILSCANDDGSEDLELIIIATARCPSPSNNRSGVELGFDYRANEKFSRTTSIFFEWIRQCDQYIGQSDGRKDSFACKIAPLSVIWTRFRIHTILRFFISS